MTQLAPPRSYIEWSACLDLLEQGLDDAATLAAMEQGTLGWTSGVAELFSERLNTTLDLRLQRCAEQLSRQLRSGADEVTLVRALLNTRATLANLRRLATLAPFPAMLQAHVNDVLKGYAERTQASLEDNAKTDRSGRLASLLRNNSILAYAAAPSAPLTPAHAAAGHASSPSAPRRRTILS
jgi:hypothetical protein